MQLTGIDLNLLVAFDVLMEERSVTRAARRLGLSQSATSHALQRLRDWVGDPLFTRTARGMVPTARALELAGPVSEALRQITGAFGPPAPFDLGASRALFRLCAFDLAQVLFVPRLVARLAREAPGVQLVVLPYQGPVARMLAEGEADLAVGLGPPAPDVHQAVLSEQRFRCVVRRDHPCLASGLTLEVYAALPHALVSPRGVPRGFVDRALALHGRVRRVVLTTPHVLSAALAVASSDLVLTAAEAMCVGAASVLPLVVLDPPLAIEPFPVTMAWHDRRDEDPLNRWVRQALTEIAA